MFETRAEARVTLEVETCVENEASHTAVAAGIQTGAQRGDGTEVGGFDVHVVRWRGRIVEVRVVENVHDVHAELEGLRFRDFHALHHIHIKVKRAWSAN